MPGWVYALGGLILLGLIVAIAVTVIRIGRRQPVTTQPTVTATAVVPPGTEAGPTATTAVDLLDQVLAAGKLRVSSDANYAPQSFLDENSNWSGFDVEVAREVAKRLGVELELMATDWDIVTGGSWDARWDVSIGSMVATEERGKVLWFANPYYYTPAGFAVHASNTRYAEVEDLAGAIIGVGAGTTYERWLNKDLTIAIPGYDVVFADWKAGEVRPYSTDVEASHDLALGDGVRLNAVMGPVPTLQEIIKIGQPLKLLGDPTFYEPLCFALDKARGPSDKMLAELNGIIAAMHEDGTLTGLSMQFYGEDLTFAARMPSPREPTEAPIKVSTSESIKIALLAPLSGDAATLGESVRNGAMMAIDEWNARGGILGRQIEAVVEDSQCSAELAVSAANKVIDQDGVKYIIGEVCSSASIPASDIATAKSVLQISPTSTNPQVTVDQSGNAKPTVFRACFIDSFQGRVAAKFALEQLGARTVAVFLDQGNEYVRGLAEYFRQAFEAGGGQVVVWETYTYEDQDFSAILTKVKDANPDVLYLPDYYSTVNVIAAQAREKGITAVMMGGDGWDSAQLDRTATEGGYFTNHYAPEDPRPVVQEWVKKYQARYGSVPDALATLGYDAANVLFQAIEKAGADDPVKVAQTMEGMQFEAVTGPIAFDSQHNPVKPACIFHVTGGEAQFVTTLYP